MGDGHTVAVYQQRPEPQSYRMLSVVVASLSSRLGLRSSTLDAVVMVVYSIIMFRLVNYEKKKYTEGSRRAPFVPGVTVVGGGGLIVVHVVVVVDGDVATSAVVGPSFVLTWQRQRL